MNRHQLREHLVFALYRYRLLGNSLKEEENELLETINKEMENKDSDASLKQDLIYVETIFEDIMKNEEEYIKLLSNHLQKWSFDRLGYVDQAILLCACSEIKTAIVEKAISLNEAISLAKDYGDEDSYRYINAVLDNI